MAQEHLLIIALVAAGISFILILAGLGVDKVYKYETDFLDIEIGWFKTRSCVFGYCSEMDTSDIQCGDMADIVKASFALSFISLIAVMVSVMAFAAKLFLTSSAHIVSLIGLSCCVGLVVIIIGMVEGSDHDCLGGTEKFDAGASISLMIAGSSFALTSLVLGLRHRL